MYAGTMSTNKKSMYLCQLPKNDFYYNANIGLHRTLRTRFQGLIRHDTHCVAPRNVECSSYLNLMSPLTAPVDRNMSVDPFWLNFGAPEINDLRLPYSLIKLICS